MALKVIALTGPKGSGKDTVAQLMKEQSSQVQTIAFADPMKQVIKHIFNLKDEGLYSYDRLKRATIKLVDEEEFFSIEGRRIVREIGMLMRSYDENQFTKYVEQTMLGDPDKIWIVTDLRFDNEYLMLKRLGAKIVKIIRPHYDYDGHITERAFDDHLVDSVLMNTGDLIYLKHRVEVLFNAISKEWE